MSTPDDTSVSRAAQTLRSLHVAGNPLVLVNAWDVASAREVEAAGAAAIGTSSNAIASSLGTPDNNTMPRAHAFGAIKRIATAVSVPVTADVEGGYDLPASELVSELLAAGAVGCNLEDTDHHSNGGLLAADVMVARLRAMRSAARELGVRIVINARIDALLHGGDDRAAALAEIMRRASPYINAGADCIFPIGVGDLTTAEHLVSELGAPINVTLDPGVTVAQMAATGVSRISFGPTLQRRAMADLRQRATELLAPVDATHGNRDQAPAEPHRTPDRDGTHSASSIG